MSKKMILIAGLFALICAAPSRADLVVAASGAGDLPGTAEDLTGVPVTEITGDIPVDSSSAAMFAINIVDFADFSALTVGGAFGIPDTELFLFNSAGLGVLGNDDIDGGNTLSCLPSAAAGNLCSSSLPGGVGPTSDGLYYLAVTRSENGPLSVDGEIFTILDSTDIVGPDLTAGGNSPITGWDGGAFTSSDTDLTGYDIQITGTPEPSTWALMAFGLAFILVRRKQLARQ